MEIKNDAKMIYEILLNNGSLIKRWVLINQTPNQLVIAEKPKNYDFHETYHINGEYHFVVRTNKNIVRKELKYLPPINNFSGIVKLKRHILKQNPFTPTSNLAAFSGNKVGYTYLIFNYDGSKILVLDIYLTEHDKTDLVESIIDRFKSKNSKYYQGYKIIDDQNPCIIIIFSLVDGFKNEDTIKTITGTEILKNPKILRDLNL
jgi:hypothetical protein